MDGVVGCDVAWTAVGLIACRLSDCCSWIALYLFCLDGINLLRRIWYGYFAFVSVLLSVIFTVDLGLYEYWGFRLDATPLFYFFSSPKDAVASVSIWVVIGELLQWLPMWRHYTGYSMACCCGNGFSNA